MPRLYLSLFVVFQFACAALYGQEQFRFSRLGIDEGLSQSCVTSLYQDEFNMVWIGTQDGLNRYNGSKIDIFRPVTGDTTSLYSNNIKTVCGDGRGKVYVLCKFALCELDLATEKFRTLRENGVQAIAHTRDRLWVATDNTVYTCDNGQLKEYYRIDSAQRISCLYETSAGQLLIGTIGSGMKTLDNNRKEVASLPDRHIVNLYEDSKRNIWVATQRDGLYKIEKSGEVVNYRYDARDPLSLSDNYVRSVCEDTDGNYWIGTFKGVNILNPETHTIVHADHSNQDPNSLPHSSIWSIIRDHQGTMWIGSYFGGISLYNQSYDFYRYHKQFFANPRRSVISTLIDDGLGDFWIGSEGAGLAKYNTRTGKLTEYATGEGSLSSVNIKSLYLDRQAQVLWIGTLLGGLDRMDLRTGAVRVFRRNANAEQGTLPNNNIRKIIPWGDNHLLLATHRGIARFDTRTFTSTMLDEELPSATRYISDMMLDSGGKLWYAVSEGVVRYDLHTGKYNEYFFEKDSQLGHNHVLVIFEDSRGRVWLGSSGGGVLRYLPDSDTFQAINGANSGLANDYILAIKESRSGYILLATNGGLVRYDPENNVFYNYNSYNGFPISDILPYGLYVASDNEIYVSGYKSLVSFNEKDLTEENHPADIYFTSLNVNNKRIEVGDESGILQRSLLYQREIDLYNRHWIVAIDYTTSNYVPFMNNEIEYRLEGFGQDWVRGVKGQPIVFTRLEPRTYRLFLRSIDARTKKVLASNVLTIHMHPPFYKTVWAYLLLAAMIIAVVFAVLRDYVLKLKMRASLELEKREKEQVQEITQAKMRFFTYVSHELRTPATLIQSQIDSMLGAGNLPPSIYNRVMSVSRNLGKINRLVNELLDFKKQEQDFQQMNFDCQDIGELLNKVYFNFREYAESKHIHFHFEHTDEAIPLWFDPEQLEKVFYNLLSNAFKHTPGNGEITLSVSRTESDVAIKVSDTGDGIPPAHQAAIFEPFYQVPYDNHSVMGTGLGLTVTRGIVRAHYGEIVVESEPGQGTVFTVTLPLGKEHIPEELISVERSEDELCLDEREAPDARFIEQIVGSQREVGLQSATIMIVEDNDELREYLVSLFSPIYKVVAAADGLDAWQKLSAAPPDIILSDLMMPGMDGNELCAKVKNNLTTSHIPFVMLTAKVAVESTLEGFRHGADDYIAKPFNARILITKCNNLVNSRIHLQNKFAKSTTVKPHILALNQLDQQLVEKAASVVTAHIADPNFDIVLFAREMALGRTKLFSKLKGVTGQTPTQFITNIRLKQSIAMLSERPELSVGEISFLVGFNSSSYFIKSFRSLYGVTPAAFRENLTK